MAVVQLPNDGPGHRDQKGMANKQPVLCSSVIRQHSGYAHHVRPQFKLGGRMCIGITGQAMVEVKPFIKPRTEHVRQIVRRPRAPGSDNATKPANER